MKTSKPAAALILLYPARPTTYQFVHLKVGSTFNDWAIAEACLHHWCAHAGSSIVSQTFIDSENGQVFLPDGCSLRSLDPARFNDQMAGRRMIFLGDSLMRGNWQSLACWLADQVSMNPKTSADIDLCKALQPCGRSSGRHDQYHRGMGTALI